MSLKNSEMCSYLCVIDVFTKYPWFKPLKDKKAKAVLHAFVKTVNK